MALTDPADRLRHQTARLGRGRHDGPGDVVCVMELASMLAGERFSDRPAAVCPMLGALMRAYNDVADDDGRQALYPYASDCVGTKGDYELERRRAARALAVAQSSYEARRTRWRRLLPRRPWPVNDDGPELIAETVIREIRPSHASVLALLDELIAMRACPQARGGVRGEKSSDARRDRLEAPAHAGLAPAREPG
jgi:hypothetical protein